MRLLSVWVVARASIACPGGGGAGGGAVTLETMTGSPSTGGVTADPEGTTPTTSATGMASGFDATFTSGTSSASMSDMSGMSDTSGMNDTSGVSDTSGMSSGGATGGSPSSTSELPPSHSCGDGELDPGEMCDPGAAELDDHGACTLECALARCGDDLVRDGLEVCDEGDNNNDDLYGGCTTQCQWGPRCKDGVIQGPEECDLGEDNGTGSFPENGVPCDAGCRFQARVGFISSVAYKGGDLGGVEGADLKCQALAKLAKFDNAASFKAWISDAQHNPLQDFNHGPDTVGLAYVRPDGVRIADDWDDLILNGPGDGIIVSELDEKVLGAGVWTGTAPSGKVFDASATCQAWSSSAVVDKSRRGLSGVDKQQAQAWMQWVTDKQWTSYTSFACQITYRIYCLEQ